MSNETQGSNEGVERLQVIVDTLTNLALENKRFENYKPKPHRRAGIPSSGQMSQHQALRCKINKVIIEHSSYALQYLSLRENLDPDHIEAILLVSDLNNISNSITLPRFIKNNLKTPTRILHRFATESNNKDLLKVLTSHTNSLEETRVLAAMRLATLSEED